MYAKKNYSIYQDLDFLIMQIGPTKSKMYV